MTKSTKPSSRPKKPLKSSFLSCYLPRRIKRDGWWFIDDQTSDQTETPFNTVMADSREAFELHFRLVTGTRKTGK